MGYPVKYMSIVTNLTSALNHILSLSAELEEKATKKYVIRIAKRRPSELISKPVAALLSIVLSTWVYS